MTGHVRQVEFRHLKYIVAVAEAGNFTRAAERLFLSQPSLSKQIKDIENENRSSDLRASSRRSLYNSDRQMVVDYAVATLCGRTHVFKLAKEIFSGAIPPLRMGFSCFVNSRHLQTFRSLYANHFPLCSVQLSGGDTVHILQRMERGRPGLRCSLPSDCGPKWLSSPSQARRWLRVCVLMLSAALCSSRAREIATTAQRMVARTMTA